MSIIGACYALMGLQLQWKCPIGYTLNDSICVLIQENKIVDTFPIHQEMVFGPMVFVLSMFGLIINVISLVVCVGTWCSN